MTKKELHYPTQLGERIRLARLSLDMSQDELAEAVELPRPAISLIEAGKRAVDSMELVAFARALKKPVSFFLEPESEEAPDEDVLNVLYRADEITEQDRAVVEDFRILCKDYATLEDLLDLRERSALPKWNVEVTSKWQAITIGREAAMKLRASLGLGFGPLKDLAAVLENHGVKIVNRPMRKDSKAWGFSITSKTFGNCIFINARSAMGRQNFTLSHELGHLVLDHHHTATIYSAAQSPETLDDGKQALIETRANVFAAEFLAPELGVKEVLSKLGIDETSKERLTPHVVHYIAEHFGMSYESMLWRLINIKMISKQEREDFARYQDQFAQPIPVGNEREVTLPERYKALALEAYKRTKISIGRLAEFLRTDLYEVRDLVKKYGIQQSAA
jgi:Zn-dependent peptidase ImmA (M78 family)/transcriptional regulator with XRE-family HTH domain